MPPHAGPRVRGYRQQEVLWTDKVYNQARDLGRAGDAGYDAGGGLTLYRTAPTEANPEGTVKRVRTAKVQPVPKDSEETTEMPEHLRVLGDRTLYDSARAKLRSYAVAVVKYLQDRPGRTARVRQIGREWWERG